MDVAERETCQHQVCHKDRVWGLICRAYLSSRAKSAVCFRRMSQALYPNLLLHIKNTTLQYLITRFVGGI